ncbi:MAG: HAMP domain-containing sensor histidine kinase [Thiotrichaceae bacterium]
MSGTHVSNKPWHAVSLSLSLKLVLLFIITGIIILTTFRTFVGSSFRQHFQENVRPHFQQYIRHLHKEIGHPPDLKRAEELSKNILVDIIIDGPDMHWSSNGKFPDTNKLRFKSTRKRPHAILQRGFYQHRFFFRIQSQGYSTLFITQGQIGSFSLGKTLIIGLISILSILAILYFAIRRLFQPIKTIQSDVARIGSGELSHRISISRQDELGSLAETINHMADEIEQILEAKRQLLLAISHELRSPITRAKVALSLMDESPSKKGLEQDLQEMEGLIHELLEAERLKSKHQTLQLTKCSLNELIEGVIASHYSEVDIKLQLAQNLPLVLLDESRMHFIIKNLLSNALKHQKEDSPPVLIVSSQSAQRMKLSVQDYGQGIAAEHLPHLTEPFYRADSSRQRKTGGFGLGLYLVRLIMEAHNGELNITSKLGEGTQVTITLPIQMDSRDVQI